MKKFLVILMVVVMASFLLVGCLPTTNVGPVFTSTAGTTATVGTVYSYTPTATDADGDTVTFAVAGPTGMAISAGVITWTPTTAQIGTENIIVTASDGTNATAQEFTITVSAAVEPVVVTTVAPVLLTVVGIDLTSSSTQYINAAGAALVVVTGTAPTYSEVKVYVDAVCAGTADVAANGTFTVVVAEADLGVDGAKVIYATAKEAALAVSAHSTEYAFILDTVKPKATTLAATAFTDSSATPSLVIGVTPITGLATGGWGTLAAGTWTITCLGDSTSVTSNVKISDGTTSTLYEVTANATIFNGVIPGITFTFVNNFDAGDGVTITVVARVAERATVLFDEVVTYASASAAANFVWLHTTTLGIIDSPDETFVSYNSSNKTSYFSPFSGTAFDQNGSLKATVNGLVDLAGNTQTTASVITCTIGKASLTALKP